MCNPVTNIEYKISYTAGALLFQESLLAIQSYIQTKNWKKTQQILVNENLFQTRMISSANRIVRETIKRLQVLSEGQIQFFINASRRDQICLLWYAICKHYRFINDFAIEVIREKYLRFDYNLSENDYRVFFNAKSEWHLELEKLTASTQNKAKQILFRMLREAEIINSNNMIIGSLLSQDIKDLIKKDLNGTLAIFPVPESLL